MSFVVWDCALSDFCIHAYNIIKNPSIQNELNGTYTCHFSYED